MLSSTYLRCNDLLEFEQKVSEAQTKNNRANDNKYSVCGDQLTLVLLSMCFLNFAMLHRAEKVSDHVPLVEICP
jgi:hypothetical protein